MAAFLLLMLFTLHPWMRDTVQAAPVLRPEDVTLRDAQSYLIQFGYLPELKTNSSTFIDMRSALKRFQAMAGIKETGVLDSKTKKFMTLPRCGNADLRNGRLRTRRVKRYVLQGSAWHIRDLTYDITKYPDESNMPRWLVDKVIERAFKTWSDAADLTFRRVTNKTPDIEIRFERGSHGDGQAFDGPGRVLAHAFYPDFGGDAHLDTEENFTDGTDKGINLFIVIVHELGHSLGLEHSQNDAALMAPFYAGYQPNFQLHQDDIDGIRLLYPPRTATPSTSTKATTLSTVTSTTSPTTPDVLPTVNVENLPRTCRLRHLDAAVYLEDFRRTFFFSGDKYWRVNDARSDEGYPAPISSWTLPNNVDAAINSPHHRSITYFFKGRYYWKFRVQTLLPGYPRRIGKDGFFGLPTTGIDSAFKWGNSNDVYFTKGGKFYRAIQNENTRNLEFCVLTPAKSLRERWHGLPDAIDAALQYRGKTYLFRGQKYWRLNITINTVDEGYPKSTLLYWLGCNTGGRLARTNYG